MKLDWSHIEPFRKSVGEWQSKEGDHFGWFVWMKGQTQIRAMAADGIESGWDHVSVSVAYRSGSTWTPRTPKWDEMCWIKSLFWDSTECVVQFHPPESEYVNVHNHCLHLWKQINAEFPMPPKICV